MRGKKILSLLSLFFFFLGLLGSGGCRIRLGNRRWAEEDRQYPFHNIIDLRTNMIRNLYVNVG